MVVSLAELSRHDTDRLTTPVPTRPLARVATSRGEPARTLAAPANPMTWVMGPGGSWKMGLNTGVAPGLATLKGRVEVGKSTS